MTYHGGKIVTTVVPQAIFWGPFWSNPSHIALPARRATAA
jgi:hypothetical protein